MSEDRKIRLTPLSRADLSSRRREAAHGTVQAGSLRQPQRPSERSSQQTSRSQRRAPEDQNREEAYRTIKISDGRRQVTIPMAKAVVRALAVNAARGQLRSQQLFASLLSQTERANKALSDEWLQTAIEYKRAWDAELVRRTRLGFTGLPDPLPHPDDIVIDMKAGAVRIKGPMTKEEKIEWDRMWDQVEECDRSIAELTANLKRCTNKRIRAFVEDDIAHETRIRAIIVDAIGEPKRRAPKST